MRQKTVLITGCSQGSLGSALALAFQAQGAQVIATARSQSKVSHLHQNPNPSSTSKLPIQTLLLDVCDQQSIRSCAEQITSLDILINNAGGLYAMPLADADLESSKRLFDLNVWSHLAVTQAFLPALIRSKGLIVMQTSISSVCPVPWNGIYNSSKAALAMLTDTLRLEMEPFGVRVVELKTGAVASRFYENQNQQSNAAATSPEQAQALAPTSAKLPAHSIYAKAKQAVESAMTGTTVLKDAMPADVWARVVVKTLMEKPEERRIWKGHNAFGVWVAGRFMPAGFLDGNMRKMGRLDEVQKFVKGGP
ncbi:hypothetical protein LTR10_014343 [Elasticomyces elasticus]|uniref:Uncharacterized protein n=1 Tax=Exophiala sideris TaxID=1016849 RepID=A0ABR0JIZ7_9EURO|nr:hypothetical protein LTR10_014343 [Elasticomyces elasticus]KAK5034385.1 hypothetical protein LTS07_003306 [Exophiala sideris]KAK5042682.1 hypothetical protein LTR13_001530 [Exophiala sideris]KAK5065764.1 hypothetical protein LTR69_003314 [Exophiala sideris]